MSNTFIVSDTHFGHVGVTRFLNEDGSKLRPWDTVEAMDEAMVLRWNSEVRPQDTVYHLGDVVINRRALPTLGRLNGRKILVKGNHDVFRLEEYALFFEDVRAVGTLDGFVLTHIPVHPDSIERWAGNFHGHTHSGRVMLSLNYRDEKEIDPRYLCLCVEQTNFTPISLEDAKARFEAQQ
jgi:calcineurin-like phosphoesterase family protein